MSAIGILEYAAQAPDSMKKGLIQKFTEDSITASLLKWVPVEGMSYQYAEMVKLPGMAFRALGATYASDVGVINPLVEVLKLMGGVIQADHQLLGTPVHANMVAAAMRAAALFYDYNFINGNTAVDPKAFMGLKYRLNGPQVIYAGTNGAPITLNMVDSLLDKVAGPNTEKVLLMSKVIRRRFKQLLINAAGGASIADVSSGVINYDGAKIVIFDEDDEVTPVLPLTETRGTSNVTGSIYCIRPGKDPEGEYVQGLIRGDMITHKELALVGTQGGDLIEMFCGLGVFHPRAAARLAGLIDA